MWAHRGLVVAPLAFTTEFVGSIPALIGILFAYYSVSNYTVPASGNRVVVKLLLRLGMSTSHMNSYIILLQASSTKTKEQGSLV